MFTHKQAALNKRLGLFRYCRWLSDDPQTCLGFGTAIRSLLYLMCVSVFSAISFRVLFQLPQNESGKPDYTQLPVKSAFFIFGIEVLITMIFFTRVAQQFSSRHISRVTCRRMSTGILVFSSSLFWFTYSVVFFSFIFFRSDHLKQIHEADAPRAGDFPSDMYRMHKNWAADWIDRPFFLFLYSSSMFVAFPIYIVSVSGITVVAFCLF
jgi:hypothetical protein